MALRFLTSQVTSTWETQRSVLIVEKACSLKGKDGGKGSECKECRMEEPKASWRCEKEGRGRKMRYSRRLCEKRHIVCEQAKEMGDERWPRVWRDCSPRYSP